MKQEETDIMHQGKRSAGLACLMVAGVVGLAVPGRPACAQATDPAQLEQLGRIQDNQDQRRVALDAARQQAAMREAQLRERQSQEAAASAARIAAARRARAETDWQDDRRYREASRMLELKEEQLKLKMLESRAGHADEFVKADLDQKKAETERLRQGTQGDEALKSDMGQALKMSQRHWWESR